MKLTLPQQDVYFEQLLYRNDPIYNIGAKIIIEGNVVYEVFNQAYIALIEQHDAYRSIIKNSGATAEIDILPTHNSVLGYIDFSSENNAKETAESYMQETFQKAFNFDKEELLHTFVLLKVSDELYYLFSMYHHIITDGWGTSIMFQRLVKNYNELIETGTVVTEYPYSYTDFVIDDKKYAESEDFNSDKTYWKNKFQHLPERIFERIDETVHINKSKRKELFIKRSVYNKLETIAKASRCSTFHVILGILYLYFGRKHQNKDFAIGLPVLNRGKSIFKKTVGLFMGVAALRMQLNFEDTFEELILAIKQQLRQDYRHQRFPLGKLIQELNIFQDKDRLFNITLSYEKQNYADHFHGTKTSVIPMTHESERVALAVYIREFDALEDVKIDLDYNINYFDEATIHQIGNHIEELIVTICENPKEKLSDCNYLTTSVQQELLHAFNATEATYPKEETLLSFFQKQVAQNATQIAVTDGKEKYSYKELNERSNRVANYITTHFHEEGNIAPIAVLLARSADLIVTLLGILKSGHAYIPLDPEFPQERLEYIVAHSEVKCIIGTANLAHKINTKANFVTFSSIQEQNIHAQLPKINALQTAYIIYTSGSTGNPKGVSIGHQALLNFLLSIQKQPKISNEDVLFSVTTQSFDISILEFFTPLISGATVHVATKELLSNPLQILTALKNVNPSVMQATPSFYQLLFNAGWTGNKDLKVLCGGDLLSTALAEKLVTTCGEVWNMYGPTETTIWSSIKKIEKAEEASCIGKPIDNTQLYILDENLQLLPIGSTGAIYIGGDGLAQGYYKNDSLTAEKFITNPFDATQKIYETGDLGKWNAKGEIEFLGRNDYQVKIRGYRIELGEIETKLNQLNTVKEAVVIAKKSNDQEAVLIAYIVPSETKLDTAAIIQELRKELPEYMIPYTILPIERFPLTPNKKVDRKSLSQQQVQQITSDATNENLETATEITLATYFTEILELKENIGSNANFFMLGGHSLNAVKLINRIEKELQQQLSLKTIFEYPTVATLASFLDRNTTQTAISLEKAATQTEYPITTAQYGVWLASQKKEKSIAYNMPAVYKIVGEIDVELFEKAFKNSIQKHEIIRTNFIEIAGTPHQKVVSNELVEFKIDLNFSEENTIEAYIYKEFNLETDLLLRVAYVATEKTILFVTHHIIMDGWSLELLINEVITNYKKRLSESIVENDTLEFQFKDYAVWQQKVAAQTEDRNQKFWKEYLKNYEWKSTVQSNIDTDELAKAAEYKCVWDEDFLTSILEVVKAQNITLHTFLVTTFNVLVHKMYAHNDICIGTVNSGRTRSELQEQIGMFVKTVPLRTRIDSDERVKLILAKTHENLLNIDAHQDIPAEIQNDLRLDVLMALQTPSFNYENISVTPALDLVLQLTNTSYNRLPLLINFIQSEKQLSTIVHYNTTAFEAETIELLFLKYKEIITQIITNTNLTIADITTALAFEKQEVIDIDFNF
ncbi:amino acid adenylation domain-containing protein [Kordia sp.]|uniref:amino acid adenylation domain-containing protein n=1 Tax=Kordia sp. TaxID=1965332 RepID=UPI003D271DAC